MRFKFTIAAVILVFLGLVAVSWFSGSAPSSSRDKTNYISATDEQYDFGEISMSDGNVRYSTTIKNTKDEPVTLTKLHTSCMCTDVTLTSDGEVLGPFGMEGHGNAVEKIEFTMAPGQEGWIEIEFDPAAHGAAGVGMVEREIFIDTADGARAKLKFNAMVTP